MSASTMLTGIIAAQQTAATCHSQQARAVPAAMERRLIHRRTSDLAALPLPRHGESAAADLAASHRDLDDPILSIEGARKYACVISPGAVAVLVRFSVLSPAGRRRRISRFVAVHHQGAPSITHHLRVDMMRKVYIVAVSRASLIFYRRLGQDLARG